MQRQRIFQKEAKKPLRLATAARLTSGHSKVQFSSSAARAITWLLQFFPVFCEVLAHLAHSFINQVTAAVIGYMLGVLGRAGHQV